MPEQIYTDTDLMAILHEVNRLHPKGPLIQSLFRSPTGGPTSTSQTI